jgi:hypothetical protein
MIVVLLPSQAGSDMRSVSTYFTVSANVLIQIVSKIKT